MLHRDGLQKIDIYLRRMLRYHEAGGGAGKRQILTIFLENNVSDRHDIFGKPTERSPEPRQQARTGQRVADSGREPQTYGRPAGGPPKGAPPSGGPRRSRLILAIVADVLIAGLVLLLFYVTNITPSPEDTGTNTPPVSSIISTNTPSPAAINSPSPTPTQTATPTPTPDPKDLRAKFADKFTTGEPEQTENSYKGKNVNVSWQMVQKDGVTYRVIDIYVADARYFRTAFSKNKFSPGHPEFVDAMSKTHNAVAAINGDYCTENAGPVLRNGVNHTGEAKWSPKYKDPKLFRDGDVLFMYKDGTMKTLLKGEFTMDMLDDENLWQAWTFGPQLLQDGQPKTKFNSTVAGRMNPRTAVGYYEPGHYCFVNVEGRIKRSRGMTMSELSKLFSELGCKEAFNLDGGGTAQMAFMGNRINQPAPEYRRTADMIYITDQDE